MESDIAKDAIVSSLGPSPLPILDFKGSAERVRLLVEGYRLSFGHLFNPTFATEISRIDPLPHQRLAVYERMLPEARLRFLLADDAGAGKTIMTGLYIREMLNRRLINRILIVPPAGLVGNWEQELRRLFDLHFTIITGMNARRTNPFTAPNSDMAIISVSTLCGERLFAHLQSSNVKPYDLVVFDEAHKLSAYRDQDLRVHKTARYKLAEALSGVFTDDPEWQLSWSCQHLLLLSATPHMGKDIPYYYLWSLLEPEIFTSYEAFRNYPQTAKRKYFIRRTKEEMIDFSGKPLYPRRKSTTLSYDLTQGAISEQTLYDETTQYIHDYYNAATHLNRSAVRLAMSVFQRRLASSSWALFQSLRRRKANLYKFVTELEAGRMPFKLFQETQQHLDALKDTFASKTADEEENPKDGKEENEGNEQNLLRSTVALTLEDLRKELERVTALCQLAQQVFKVVEDAKFEKLRELLRDERYIDDKILIFTEHRDTLHFLLSRLEGMGYTGIIASIHGGMEYQRREQAVQFFRRPLAEGGARFLIATDAAGEGINLQVCWIMVNYDLPWNPARLEQRMGRIHRYGQQHDPVFIFNLVAGKTREGRVMHTLLDKLEHIKAELGSDKVYDVLGTLMEDISLQDYFTRLQEREDKVEQTLDQAINKDRVITLQQEDLRVLGPRDTVKDHLPRLQEVLSHEQMQWLLPGYMRQFIEHAASILHLSINGSLEKTFSFHAQTPASAKWLSGALASYSSEKHSMLTVSSNIERNQSSAAIFLHPGETLFEQLCERVNLICSQDGLRGAVFADANAQKPYFYYLLEASILRRADATFPQLNQSEILEKRLIAFKQQAGPEELEIEASTVEELLLLRPLEKLPDNYQSYVERSHIWRGHVLAFAHNFFDILVAQHRLKLENTRAARTEEISLGFEYLEIDLLQRRARLQGKQDTTNAAHFKGELTKIEKHFSSLHQRKRLALNALQKESELLEVGEITLLAHALVIPDVATKKRHDIDVEGRAMQIAIEIERQRGANVFDVSTPSGAVSAGLSAWPGFDLLAKDPTGEYRAIEVKGRIGIGTIELTENEYGKACTLRDRYWLYVVFDCEKQYPRLLRVQDPFGKLVVRTKGSVMVESRSIFEAATPEMF